MILRRICIFAFLALVLSTTGFSCTLIGGSSDDDLLLKPITLEYWRVFDPSDSVDDMIAAYRKLHRNVTINTRTFRYEEYEQQLLDAFAEDRGPDIFSVPNSWVDRYRTKILPLPPSMRVGYTQIVKADEPTVSSVGVTQGYTSKQVTDQFIEVVANDVIRHELKGDVILGLPYSADVLA